MLAVFVIFDILVTGATAFVLSLAVKWGLLEWAQVHSPNEFISKLLNCKFCLSFWTGLLICVILSVTTGNGYLLLVPICSTPMVKELW